MSYEFNGTVKCIFEEETFASGFNKRAFVVTEDKEKYPQDIQFECLKERVAMVEDLRVGDQVKVMFQVNGREWNGRYFVNLVAWSVKVAGQEERPARTSTGKPPMKTAQPADEVIEEDIPF